jgi:hypothetical protein
VAQYRCTRPIPGSGLTSGPDACRRRTPPDAAARTRRLRRSLARWRSLTGDIAAIEAREIEVMLAGTDAKY